MSEFSEQDRAWMTRALKLAEQAEQAGEVPVGAVLVQADTLIGEGYNAPILMHDPTAHAEVQALREGASTLENYRLPGSTLYVTLEPCAMCAGAIVHARVERVVIAAREPRAGAAGSSLNLLDDSRLNHRCSVQFGLFEAASRELLRGFFKARR